MKMDTKIEGIIISKVPYRERDCIANVLLKNGEKKSIIFYGGMGGGEKKKSSLLELGFVLNIELKESRKESELIVAKEWQVKWFHKKIRLNHRLFYLLTFFCEVISRVTTNDETIYTVLSNAIFRAESQGEQSDHILLFLIKLIVALGVFPNISSCVMCGSSLENILFEMRHDHGGFCCQSCSDRKIINQTIGHNLILCLEKAAGTKYQDFENDCHDNRDMSLILFNYFCFQFNLRQMDFKSLPLVL